MTASSESNNSPRVHANRDGEAIMTIEHRYHPEGHRDTYSRLEEELGDEGNDLWTGPDYHSEEAENELWQTINDDLLQLKQGGASVEVVSDCLAACDSYTMTKTVLRNYVTNYQQIILRSAIDDSDIDDWSDSDRWETPETEEGWHWLYDLLAWEIVNRPPEERFSGGPFPKLISP